MTLHNRFRSMSARAVWSCMEKFDGGVVEGVGGVGGVVVGKCVFIVLI